jgi:hypothetical protein
VLKDLVQVFQKAGSSERALGSVVIRGFFVYIGLGAWADDQRFSHGGGD